MSVRGLGSWLFGEPRTTLLRALGLVVLVKLGACGACTPFEPHPEAVRRADLGIEYLKNGQCIQAEESCRLALEYGESFKQPHNCLGMVELNCRNDLQKAKAHFKDAISVDADFAEAHNNLGAIFFRENPPNYDAACEEFKAALEIDPGYGDARENYGMCLMRQGKVRGDRGEKGVQKELYTEARSHLIRLLEQNPNNFNARHHLGFMDMEEQRYESAEQNFRRCLEIDPENPTCCYNLGHVFLTTERCDQAIQQFICSLRAGVETEVSILARKNLGASYEACAKKDGAILTFLEKIKADPSNPINHYDLGSFYAEKGLSDQAVNEWENTVKLDPRYCPAYFELSMVANKNLDSMLTIRRCQDYVACITEKSKNEPVDAFGEKVERCKTLVKKLEME